MQENRQPNMDFPFKISLKSSVRVTAADLSEVQNRFKPSAERYLNPRFLWATTLGKRGYMSRRRLLLNSCVEQKITYGQCLDCYNNLRVGRKACQLFLDDYYALRNNVDKFIPQSDQLRALSEEINKTFDGKWQFPLSEQLDSELKACGSMNNACEVPLVCPNEHRAYLSCVKSKLQSDPGLAHKAELDRACFDEGVMVYACLGAFRRQLIAAQPSYRERRLRTQMPHSFRDLKEASKQKGRIGNRPLVLRDDLIDDGEEDDLYDVDDEGYSYGAKQ